MPSLIDFASVFLPAFSVCFLVIGYVFKLAQERRAVTLPTPPPVPWAKLCTMCWHVAAAHQGGRCVGYAVIDARGFRIPVNSTAEARKAYVDGRAPFRCCCARFDSSDPDEPARRP